MKTLADIKRRAQVGVTMEIIFRQGAPAGAPPIPRTIKRVLPSKIIMSPWPGKTNDSELAWPAASEIRIDGPDTFSVLEDGQLVLTYRFV